MVSDHKQDIGRSGPALISRPRAWRAILRMAFAASPISALSGLFWIMRGKRVRGWNALSSVANGHPAYYSNWVRYAEPRIVDEVCSAFGGSGPLGISAVVLTSGATDQKDAVAASRDSLLKAFGTTSLPIWTDFGNLDGCRFVGNDLSDILQDMERLDTEPGARSHWLLALKAGDTVPNWLRRVLETVRTEPDISLVFWDEDRMTGGERHSPRIKPGWDEILFRSYDGLTGACMIDLREAMLAATEVDPVSDAWEHIADVIAHLALHSDQARLVHVPLVLTHRAGAEPTTLRRPNTRSESPLMPGKGQKSTLPSVSIIIPTRDRSELLHCCLASLDLLPDANDHEIIIVDNGSTQSETLEFFDALQSGGRAKIVRSPGEFNFSTLINAGVAASSAPMLCLLNNDIEAMDGAWLTAMLAYAGRPDVGAVGARLLYPNGTIQHAGVALGIGGAAGHIDKGACPRADRPSIWHDVDRIVSAVTAACLIVERSKFLAVGGMDGTAFAVDFNDVDLCLRLATKGWRSVYCANATLVHHESLSRGARREGKALLRFNAELAALRERWNTETMHDPHHSPLFRRASERCQLAF